MNIHQISVFLENRAGQLAEITFDGIIVEGEMVEKYLLPSMTLITLS